MPAPTDVLYVYDNYSDMTGDPVPGNGSYAQVLSDPIAAKNTIWLMTSGTWNIYAAAALTAKVIQPPQIFTFSTLPRRLDAYIAAGEVHLLGMNIAQGDSMTIDDPNISALARDLTAAGGGKIIFDAPGSLNGFYRTTSSIELHNNICYEGVGPASYIINNGSAANNCDIFRGNGVNQGFYASFLQSALYDTTTADNQTVQLITPADYTKFPPGSVVLIFSTGTQGEGTYGMGDWEPFFSRQYRVVSSLSSGYITLDFPIPVPLTSFVMSDGTGVTYTGIPTSLVDRAQIRNMRISTTSATDGFEQERT